jgi:hypothetical protein
MTLKFMGFPKSKGAGEFRRTVRDVFPRLNLKHDAVIQVSEYYEDDGWSQDWREAGRRVYAVVSVGKIELARAIETCWTRACLHELCHAKLGEMFGIAGLEPNLPRKCPFFDFVRHMSPEGFTEFLVDELYMSLFTERRHRKYFKPSETGSIKASFRRLARRAAVERMNMSDFADLFYIFRCNFTAKRYGEKRISFSNMLEKLKRMKRYRKCILKLEEEFNDRWRFPNNKKELQKQVGKLLGIFKSAC